MARPMYPHEQGDPDFSWLISTFLEQHPGYIQIDTSCLPVVLIESAAPLSSTRHNDSFESDSSDEELLSPEAAALRKRERGA